jgi:hypothetical protein
MATRHGMAQDMKAQRCIPLLALALAACASQGEVLTTGATPVAAPVAMGETVTRLPPPTATAGYQLTPADLQLDCKKLTGRMAVRIVQIRDYRSRGQATLVARTIQSSTTTVLGGSLEGTDPDGRYARDRAQLEAYNRRLAEKDCPNFDLETALDPNAKDPPTTRRKS